MQTNRLIATISYNTDSFLAGKLRSLVASNVLEYAYWIWHNPEEDEKKGHFHVLVKPNRRIDTNSLQKEFIETVIGEKPLKCLPFRPSKVADWILYSSHDILYLNQKAQQRQFHYTKKDFHSTDDDLFDEDWRDCHSREDSRINRVIELAKQGLTWKDIISSGLIPINHLFQYEKIYCMAAQNITNRHGREGHENEESEI